MGFKEAREEAHERWKVKRFYFWIEFIGVIVLTIVLFYMYVLFFGSKDDLKRFDPWDLLFTTPLAHPVYILLTTAVFLATWFYWFGNKFNVLLRKLRVYPLVKKWIYSPVETVAEIALPSSLAEPVNKILFGTKSKFEELDEFFYPAPKKDDFLEKVPYGKFKVFKGKFDPYIFFDFDGFEIGREDKEGTNRIISFFRGKNFDEKSGNYIDLFCALEGKIKGWGNRVVFEKIPSPLRVKTERDEKGDLIVKDVSVDLKNDVYDPVADKVSFSVEMIREAMEGTTFLFVRYLQASLKKGTKIRRRYGDELSKDEVFRKVVDIFKFMLFRKLFMGYGSVPSGWVVIRAEDYDFRRVVSTIDREVVIAIRDTNRGVGESPDDRFASMFLFLWHAFFTKSFAKEDVKDMLWAFDPLKSLTEVKLKKKIELAQSSVEKMVEENGESAA